MESGLPQRSGEVVLLTRVVHVVGCPQARDGVSSALEPVVAELHTETVPKLGPLEWFLNTPSQHRVHHARNPGYVDKVSQRL